MSKDVSIILTANLQTSFKKLFADVPADKLHDVKALVDEEIEIRKTQPKKVDTHFRPEPIA